MKLTRTLLLDFMTHLVFCWWNNAQAIIPAVDFCQGGNEARLLKKITMVLFFKNNFHNSLINRFTKEILIQPSSYVRTPKIIWSFGRWLAKFQSFFSHILLYVVNMCTRRKQSINLQLLNHEKWPKVVITIYFLLFWRHKKQHIYRILRY